MLRAGWTLIRAGRSVAIDALESGLLRRVLTDPDTGLPSRLYLDLVREWGERLVARHDERALVLQLVVTGGSALRRRALAAQLFTMLRRSDLLASEGDGLLYLFFAFHEDRDVHVISDRIAAAVSACNAGEPSEPLTVDVRELDA